MSITMKRVAALAAGLLLAAGVAACNDDKDSSAGDGKADQNQSSSSQDEGKGDDKDDGGEQGGSGDKMTLSGTVKEGTEAGCMLLEHKGEKYQLTGDKAKKIKADSKVEVTGTVSKDQMSSCMEGKPFTVESVSQ